MKVNKNIFFVKNAAAEKCKDQKQYHSDTNLDTSIYKLCFFLLSHLQNVHSQFIKEKIGVTKKIWRITFKPFKKNYETQIYNIPLVYVVDHTGLSSAREECPNHALQDLLLEEFLVSSPKTWSTCYCAVSVFLDPENLR